MKASILNPSAMAPVIMLSSLFHTHPMRADGCPAPSFAAARIIDVGSGVVSVTMGDFNGDGKPDLAVAKNFCSPEGPCTTNGSVSVVLGNGDGTFQAPMDYRVGTNPVSLVMGDINGDGKPDLAVLSYGSSGVSLLFGKGDGTFQAAVNYGAGNGASSVATGDFNGDGKADLAVASDGVIAVLLGNGDGTFQAGVNYGAGANPWSVVVSDFNGDGKSDLAVANRGTGNTAGNVSILLGRGDGTFQPSVNYSGGGYCVAVGDFNGDGRPDLVVADEWYPGTVSVLLGKGDGTFRAAIKSGLSGYYRSMAVGDFNGDGKLDLIVDDFGAGPTVSVLLGNGDGTLQPSVSYSAGQSPGSLTVGDFNGDGKPDLVVVVRGGVSLLLGGGGGFEGAVQYPAGSPVVVGDFNGDGRQDLVALNSGVSVLLGKGDGTFRAAVNYAAGSAPQSVAIGDFNRDGKPDLVTANLYANGVSVLLGKGDGGFEAGLKFSAGTNPYFVTVSDFNGDGKADLAVANFGSYSNKNSDGSVSVLLGKGDGTFQAAVNHAAGVAPWSVAVGDFNGDGKSDLVVANSGSGQNGYSDGSVSVLLGKGDGTFQTAVNYIAGLAPWTVAVGDLNGDGKPDLAVANCGFPNVGSVSVLLGKGDGTFQDAVNYRAGDRTYSVAAADFNGDGKLDLVAGHNNGVAVLLGNGDGTLQPPVNYGAGAIWSVAVGDLNGDSKPDLIVAGFSVLLNTCDSAPARIHLGVARANTGLALSWPLPYADFVLESTTSLSSTNWQLSPEVPTTNSGRLQLTAPLDQPGRFFRLRKP